MQRDGANLSVWQTLPDYVPQNSWAPGDVYDVLVVGGGITGLTTAVLLQERGQRVLLAEAASIGYGTTGATTAHLNRYLDADYAYIEKDFGKEAAQQMYRGAEEAIHTVEKLSQRYSIACDFARKTGYVLALDEEQEKELTDTVEAARRAGLAVEWTDEAPVPIPFRKAARFDGEAQFHPTKYITGLAKALEAGGGIILQGCSVKEPSKNDEHLEAESTRGTLKARHIVWATHIPLGINILHFRNAPYRSYAVAAELENDAAYPDALVYDNADPYNYYRTHEADGKRYLIAGGFDHKTGAEENTEAVFTALEAHARRTFPVREIAYRWSSQYYEPVDGLPYIGHKPGGADGEWCATGFSGNGMTLGTLAATVISDLILTGASPLADLLKPARVKPIAGFSEFVKENANVVKRFVADRFSYEKIEALAELAPGEGKLVELDGEKLAVYKSEAGAVHALNPVCTHAKCIVSWNGAEKSWDCPCHGARFSVDGTVLTGPARRALEPVIGPRQEGD